MISDRIEKLRGEMKKQEISACIITNSDPHLSEYIADYWKEREWISGFTGSNGTVVITSQKIALFTDSRYDLQAKEELCKLDAEIFITSKITSDIASWLNKELLGKQKIAINPEIFSAETTKLIEEKLATNLSLVFADLVVNLWKSRPPMPETKVFLHEVKYSGKTTEEKITEIRRLMAKSEADILLLTALDEIAWTFNIRGKDIAFNPLTTAYAAIEAEETYLFINDSKITTEVKNLLEAQAVKIRQYSGVYQYVANITSGKKLLLDSKKTNKILFENISPESIKLDKISPAAILKSRKNTTEIAGIKDACRKDGVALLRFFMWLDEQSPMERETEFTLAEKLEEFRAKQELFFGSSFDAIVAYKENAAMVHYSAKKTTAKKLLPEGLLMLDSGAQYLNGTTDITRTVALGTPTKEQKNDYTLVLKGLIALSSVKFPCGTCGCHLDVLARQFLWKSALNYGHGTGHGIGYFLGVHEGPQGIRQDANTVQLEEGMLLSNEPGIYREGKYGIRLENMIIVGKAETSEFGEFMTFETMTVFPFDKKLINFALLSSSEIAWIENYHQVLFDSLSPHLNENEKNYLEEKIKLP